MKPIDWRDVYASNRAAIERAGSAPGALLGAIGGPSSLTPQPARRPPRNVRNGRPTDTRAPNGERTFTVAGRERRAMVHVPLGTQPGAGVPLICMLHGCTQDAASFATATQMNAAADRHGFAIVYPQQERRDNQNRCWNWFLPQHQARGAGEPAEIAAIVRELIETGPGIEVDASRVFVAGLSAGGAMAAIMAATYPDLFAAVAVHSGLPYRSATDMIGAFAAMAGRSRNAGNAGAAAHAAMGTLARPIPTMVVHGSADATVVSTNGDRVLEQFITANHLASPATCDFDPARPTTTSRGYADGGYAYTRAQWTDRTGALMHESLSIDRMGHAWSGGKPGGSWTDPRGPDATEAIWRFFAHSRTASAPPQATGDATAARSQAR